MPLNLRFYVSNTQPPGRAITAPVLQALRPRPALVRPASPVIISFVLPLPDPLLDRLITFVPPGRFLLGQYRHRAGPVRQMTMMLS